MQLRAINGNDTIGNVSTNMGTISGEVSMLKSTLASDILVDRTNLAVGSASFTSNAGNDCTASGIGALKAAAGANYDTAFGYNALHACTSGKSNVAIGNSALGGLTTGNNNVAIGSSALPSGNGSKNVVIGVYSGSGFTTGSSNTFIGYNSGQSMTTGNNNIAIGNAACLTAGVKESIAMGSNALCNSDNELCLQNIDHFFLPNFYTRSDGKGGILSCNATGGTYGSWVMKSGGTHNTIEVINDAFTSLGTSVSMISGNISTLQSEVIVNRTNLAIGGTSFTSNTSSNCTASGIGALKALASVNDNTAMGYNALHGCTMGFNNVAISDVALGALTTSTENMAIGSSVLPMCNRDKNAAFGALAGTNLTTGSSNTLISYQAVPGLTTGTGNIAIGQSADLSSAITNSIVMGSKVQCSANSELCLSLIDHVYLPKLSTVSNGSGTIISCNPSSSTNADWVVKSGGMHNTIEAINDTFMTLSAPGYFWFDKPVVPSTTGGKIAWSINTGAASNLSSSGVWTCTTTGLWQFNFQIYINPYNRFPKYMIYKNGTKIVCCEQRVSTSESTTMNINFATPAQKGDMFYCSMDWNNSMPGLGDSTSQFWQGYMIASSYTPA